jgi:hypothetical protein
VAVAVTNGQAYYGKIEGRGPDYIELADVYYVTRKTDSKTGQTSNMPVRRGEEIHAPDRMILNSAHIVMLETVTPGSQIAKCIESVSGQGG